MIVMLIKMVVIITDSLRSGVPSGDNVNGGLTSGSVIRSDVTNCNVSSSVGSTVGCVIM